MTNGTPVGEIAPSPLVVTLYGSATVNLRVRGDNIMTARCTHCVSRSRVERFTVVDRSPEMRKGMFFWVLDFRSGAPAKPTPSGSVTRASLKFLISVRGRRGLD